MNLGVLLHIVANSITIWTNLLLDMIVHPNYERLFRNILDIFAPSTQIPVVYIMQEQTLTNTNKQQMKEKS